jgi:hypothetical protein
MSIDTLFNNIHHLFNNDKWICSKTHNKLSYNNATIPLDEYAFEINNFNELNVSIPIDHATYKTSFCRRSNDTTDNNIINYIKMHVDIYKNKMHA